nr:LacI family transcriptional regulator [Rhizobium sp. Q54]
MNLKQLAELLGLSQTTVSRALNGYPEVGQATRERVLKAAEETGYRPNAAARRLATGRAGSIGLVMPAAPDYYADIHFAEFLSGLGEEAARQDFHFVLMPKKPGEEEDALRWLAASGSVDGVYLAYMQENDPRIHLMHSLEMPFLIHGRSIGVAEDYPFLDVDNEAAFRDATHLLLELGHRRLALLNGPAGLDFTIRRRKGVEAALSAKGLVLDPAQVHHTAMTDEFGFRGMRHLLEQETPPTAVLCASTVLALGAIRAVNQVGLRLGRDISLIAHDDVLPLLKPEDFSVPLTTTRSSLRAAGVRVGQRLIDRIKGAETGPEQELWKAELIVRSSTGAAPR